MIDRYIVRYRCPRPQGAAALIVEDAAGAAWFFDAGQLQCRLSRQHPDERDTCARLATRLGGMARWVGVPEVAPYTLAGLRQLVGGYTNPSRQQAAAPLGGLHRARTA